MALAAIAVLSARAGRGRDYILLCALAYFGAVALLRQSSTDGVSGYVPLVMLPIIWLALFGTRRELLFGLAAMAVTLLVPFLAFGEPRYPLSAGRAALLYLTVAALLGLAIQTLVGRVRAAHDLLSGVLQAATETAIVATDRSGLITVFNRGAERMLGHRADELVGKARLAPLHDTDELATRAAELGVEPDIEAVLAVARAGTPESRHWTYVRKDGERLRVSLTVTAERDRDGAVTGFLAVGTDISERLRAEEELEAERDLSGAVVDSAGSLVMVLAPDGRIERFNQACERLTGARASDAPGPFRPARRPACAACPRWMAWSSRRRSARRRACAQRA